MAKGIEGYRHRVLGVEPDQGALVEGTTALEAAIGAEPADLATALVWRSAARAHEPGRALEIEELGISL